MFWQALNGTTCKTGSKSTNNFGWGKKVVKRRRNFENAMQCHLDMCKMRCSILEMPKSHRRFSDWIQTFKQHSNHWISKQWVLIADYWKKKKSCRQQFRKQCFFLAWAKRPQDYLKCLYFCIFTFFILSKIHAKLSTLVWPKQSPLSSIHSCEKTH